MAESLASYSRWQVVVPFSVDEVYASPVAGQTSKAPSALHAKVRCETPGSKVKIQFERQRRYM